MEILVTAFEPFAGRGHNRSLDAVRLLARPGVATRTLPVSFARLPGEVRSAVDDCQRALVLVGESGEARDLVLERVALNLIDARVADNDGERPRGRPVVEGAPLACHASWPAERLAARLRMAGYRAALSAHAGTFACNAALYLALHHAATRPAPPLIGFVHLPASRWRGGDQRAADGLALLIEELLATG